MTANPRTPYGPVVELANGRFAFLNWENPETGQVRIVRCRDLEAATHIMPSLIAEGRAVRAENQPCPGSMSPVDDHDTQSAICPSCAVRTLIFIYNKPPEEVWRLMWHYAPAAS